MAPRKNNLIPDMKETNWRTQSFANPYAPAAPKPFNFATARGGSSINASNGYRTPQNLDPNRNIGGTYRMTKMGLELSKNGQIESLSGQSYRPANTRERYFGFIDSRPGWMGQQDLANANRATYGSATPNAGQLAYEMIGVGYDKSGKFGVDPVNLGIGVALAGAGKAFRGALGAIEKYQGAKLATKLAQFDAEILANRASIRAAGRAAADVRQAARRARRSTNVRATRLQRIEEALKNRDPLMAQAAGDRAWAMVRGMDIRTVMRGKPGYRNKRMPKGAIGHHHGMHVPLEDAFPSDYYQQIWMKEVGGRTGRRLGDLYSSGNPMITRSSGMLKRPNLRTRTPISPKYTPEGKPIIDHQQLDDYTRDQVAELLDEATTFRNRSSSMLQGTPASGGRGRYAFPRSYDELVTYPSGSFDPAKYQIDAFDSYIKDVYKGTKKVKPKPKKLKGGD